VLFLDGDMELCAGWLEQALCVIRSRPDAAVLTGKVVDRPKLAQTPGEKRLDPAPAGAASVTEAAHGGGAAMYRRAVLNQVGTFNPYLYADEEPELCLRIRQAGYCILQLAQPIAWHYSVTFHAFSNFLGKRRHNFFLGYGQNMRYFLGGPLLWPYLKERGWAVAPAAMFGAGLVAATASALTRRWTWLALWAASLIVLTLVIAVHKRSLKRALFFMFARLLILEGTVRGLLLKPLDPATYPASFDIIR
jgi:hypothetical protein